MNNLVPTPRVNKHGQTVIKHMRPESGGSSSAGVVPAPVVAANHDKHEAQVAELQEAIEHVYDRGSYQYTSIVRIQNLKERITLMGRDVLSAYHDFIMEAPDASREPLLMSVLNNYLSDNDAGYVLFIAQQTGIRDAGFWDDARGGNDDYIYAFSLYRGLAYEHNFPQNILNASEDEKKSFGSVVKTINALYETDSPWVISEGHTGDKYFTVTNDPLIALAAARPSDGDAIADIIRSRGLSDPKDIAAILDAGIPALRDGAL